MSIIREKLEGTPEKHYQFEISHGQNEGTAQ